MDVDRAGGTSRRLRRLVSLFVVAGLATAGCVRTGVRDYEGWRAVVDNGEPCSVLYDIRSKLPESVDRARVDGDLRAIGCDSAQATRTDR